MSRDHNETVTHFPLGFVILVPSLEHHASGEATFGMEVWDPEFVRMITITELRRAAKDLKGAAAAHFRAMLALRGALQSRDQLALEDARDRVARAYALRNSVGGQARETIWVPKLIASLNSTIDLPPQEIAKYLDGLRPGPKAMKDPVRLLSYEVSQEVNTLLEHIRLVLWWVKGTFVPAIYCPDLKKALYVHTFFLAPRGERGFRTCPSCTEPFFQDRPNQDYCCPAHREAHRVARWRAAKKTNVEKPEQQRRNNGTHKAR